MYNIIMNQIIKTPDNLITDNDIHKEDIINKKKKFVLFFKSSYILSTIIALFFSFYYFYRLFNIDQNERLSQILMNSYDVSRLYSEGSDTHTNSSLNLYSGERFSIIGILQIDKIDFKYPILSDISDHLLQIAPCRFHGPLPNETRQFMYCSP